MTQSQLIALIRLRIPEIATTDVISDANLLILLNLACVEFIKNTDALPTSSTFNLVTDQSEYSLSTYVSNFGKIRKQGLWIYNSVSSKWSPLESTTLEYLRNNYPSYLNTTSGMPMRYSLDGDTITIHPKASSTYAGTNYLKLFHFARSIDMDGNSDYPFSSSTTINYPHLVEHEEVLVDYVKYQIKPMFGKNADAEEAKQMFYTKLNDIKNKLSYRPDLISGSKTNGAGNMMHFNGAFRK